MLHTTFRGLKMWRKPTPSLYKYNQNFKLNNCAISKIPETSHIFKPLLNAVLYFRNLKDNTTFIHKVWFSVSNITQTWFVTQSLVSVFDFTENFPKKDFQHKVWFQFSIITQDFSITISINFLAKKQERSFLRKFGKYIAFNVPRLVFRWQIQHQAITNIHKLLN